jgi:uncharacterized protein (TIGR02266 family)
MALILIIDNDRIPQKIEGTSLSRKGNSVISVRTSVDPIDTVVARMHESRPDLVVAGGEVSTIERLRNDGELKTIPVIYEGFPSEREAAVRAGADGFIASHATAALVLSEIRRFLPASERASQRLPVGLKVVCRSGREVFIAFTKDISATGLFIKSTRPPEPGTRLFLNFTLPGERKVPLESEAEVVREVAHRPEEHHIGGAGARFTSMSPAVRIAIGRFVRGGEDSPGGVVSNG